MHLGVPEEELDSVASEKEYPANPATIMTQPQMSEENGWMVMLFVVFVIGLLTETLLLNKVQISCHNAIRRADKYMFLCWRVGCFS